MEVFYGFSQTVGDYDKHIGFWVFTILVLGMSIFAYAMQSIEDDNIKPGVLSVVFIPVACLVIALIGYNSFGTGRLCENTPVIAQLVDKTPSDTYKTGKYSTENYLHVFYKTPEGEVSFKRASGVIYPERVTLYRTTCVDK